LALAYLGDGVLEILVRGHLVSGGNSSANGLHKKALEFVCAKAQSNAVEKLMPILTDEEESIYKRGRNAKGSVPKNAVVNEYKRATGFEALFGYLYLIGESERIIALFNKAYDILE
jgi:ribonuclease-3 family protein